ncbi:hypothetical protein FHT28_003094 [Rhizobium sp. SG570]|nr:hypothetical protein [Rhizobium sp. SG570]
MTSGPADQRIMHAERCKNGIEIGAVETVIPRLLMTVSSRPGAKCSSHPA